MKKDYCDISIILDESGSMYSLKQDVIDNINKFIEEQRQVKGKCTVTLVKFNYEVSFIYEGKDINNINLLNNNDYCPNGLTALNDAIGTTIDKTGERLRNLPESERPDKVVFIIQTDGHENASKIDKYKNVEKIKEMIEHQQSVYNWNFVFMGATLDAQKMAGDFGISANYATKYTNTSDGYKDTLSTISHNLTTYRNNESSNMSFITDK